jgi:tRNA A64-2'-O-ribosylphosphate transferase
LDLIQDEQGIILVDSTRRGKTIPDALSKTVPIWCAVLNYIVSPEHEENWLFRPLQFISKNEANSMIKLIPEFAVRVLELGLISQDTLKQKLEGKYLRPIWVYPGQILPMDPPTYDEFLPVICCVASERHDDGVRKMDGYTYVQGAADDHELWASELNPSLYWMHKDKLLDKTLSDDEILQMIDTLTLPMAVSHVEGVVQLTEDLYIGQVVNDLTIEDIESYKTVVLLSEKYTSVIAEYKVLRYPLECTKKGSNELRKHLPEILKQTQFPGLILCESGKDLSTGVALALLCTRYNTQWSRQSGLLVTKDVIKKHLARILALKKVNPSRATLQAVNTCIM